MHTGDAPRMATLRADGDDRQGRGVAGEHGVLGADLLEIGEHFPLHVKVLEYGLDDEVAILQGGHTVDDLDSVYRRLRLVLGQAALLGGPVEHPDNEGLALPGGTRLGVGEAHIESSLGGDLRDAATHGASAEDAHQIIFSHRRPDHLIPPLSPGRSGGQENRPLDGDAAVGLGDHGIVIAFDDARPHPAKICTVETAPVLRARVIER